jgi:hypothetical protein
LTLTEPEFDGVVVHFASYSFFKNSSFGVGRVIAMGRNWGWPLLAIGFIK